MRADIQGIAVADASLVNTEIDARFATFVHAYRDKAWRLAWRLTGGDGDAADDVTQDALLKAYGALPSFREESKLETWFFRILVRQAHSHRRWRAVRELWGAGREDDVADPRPQEHGDPLLRRSIASALDRLTQSQRDAFVLVHLEGFTVREAAKVMAKAEGTVKSHLQRALKSLRSQLEMLRTDQETNA
jgi:RNA polymerase sigma-70 factor (ECF subfamily)